MKEGWKLGGIDQDVEEQKHNMKDQKHNMKDQKHKMEEQKAKVTDQKHDVEDKIQEAQKQEQGQLGRTPVQAVVCWKYFTKLKMPPIFPQLCSVINHGELVVASLM